MRAWPRRDSLYAVRLLVVEDELRLGAALKRGLTAEGMVVDLATDGPAASRLPAMVTTTRWSWT